MTKNLFLLPLVILLSFSAFAQTDTTHIDLGRINVKKDFTQTITIKGSDLERYPFLNLTDAINVWLYGTYTNPSSVTYVINGNIINDANAYSIHDIEEITLVQNALTQAAGSGAGQQTIFIRLKNRKPGKQGIEASGQTSYVGLANPNHTTDKTVSSTYDQYYLSGYKNYQNADFGVSANYQHDVLPRFKQPSDVYTDPLKANRIKLYGYADANLWKGSSVNFNINYAPQQSAYTEDYKPIAVNSGQAFEDYVKDRLVQHLFNTAITVNSHILDGLNNKLTAAYTHYNSFERDSSYLSSVYTNVSSATTSLTNINSHSSNLLLKDYLAYTLKLKDLELEPAINFSYNKFSNFFHDVITSQTGYLGNTTTPSGVFGSNIYTDYISRTATVTPALTIAYKNAFELQGGFTDVVNTSVSNYNKTKVFPFVTSTLDLLKLFDVNTISLKLFGSFSRTNLLLGNAYSALTDLNFNKNPEVNTTYLYTTNTTTVLPVSNDDPSKLYNNYAAGAVFNVLNNLSVSYSFEQRFDNEPLAVVVPYTYNFSTTVIVFNYLRLRTNRIAINYNIKGKNLLWRTGLNVAQEKANIIDDYNYYQQFNLIGLGQGHRYTGGFTNRFAYKSVFAGLDILYQFGTRPYSLQDITSTNIPISTHINSVSVQNLYAGTQIKIRGVKYAELFACFRNLVQNNSSIITDNRKFYGLGFKVGI